MKRLFILLFLSLLLFSGCSSPSFTIEQLKPEDQNAGALPIIAPYADGFFSVTIDSYDLSYARNYDHTEYLTSMLFFDDQPMNKKDNPEQYYDYILLSHIYVNGEKLWYTAERQTKDGEICSILYRMSLDGKQREQVFELSYQPFQFIPHRNMILCVELTAEYTSLIHVYDKTGKELKTLEENGPVMSLFADGERVYYEVQDISTMLNRICYIDLDTFETTVVFEDETSALLHENDGKIAIKQLSEPFYEGADMKDIEVISKIISVDDQSILFSVSEELINCFDDEYIYTSSDKEDHVIYRLYDWSGKEIRKIIPSQMIDGKYVFDAGDIVQDFSSIVYVHNNTAIFYSFDPYVYGVCDLSSGSCRLIDR